VARLRITKRRQDEQRPDVSDDFIYDEPDQPVSGHPGSDTPEEAIRKLRSTNTETDNSGYQEDKNTEPSPSLSSGSKVYSSGIMLDDNLQPVQPEGTGKRRIRHGKPYRFIRGFMIAAVSLILLVSVGAYVFHRILPDTPGLDAPENAISAIVTPVQSFFSGITESVFGYFRTLKLRANIEAEYNALRAENEQLVYKAMLADELQQTLSQYEDLSDEIAANANMKPIVCTVIGKSDSNYYATLTINKGLDDGVEEYMAVTISGALVGYTENVQAHKATVRTIIDTDASIAALIQSSRDQGTVRGTLGIDGTPLCRMYYLPDDNLPRPGDLVVTSGVGMSFPKGIPIGVVRESTRGMDSNKQYIVLEPQVDFQHLEYVIVLRYKPEPIAVEGRENGRTSIELVPLESARPSPVIPEIAANLMESGTTENPEDLPGETASPTPEPTETPTPEPSPTPSPEPTPYVTPLEYQVVTLHGDPTPTPTPTAEPTSTPYLTPDPDAMTFEEDEQ
jgi:rod shape-determining protein MreC